MMGVHELSLCVSPEALQTKKARGKLLILPPRFLLSHLLLWLTASAAMAQSLEETVYFRMVHDDDRLRSIVRGGKHLIINNLSRCTYITMRMATASSPCMDPGCSNSI